MKKLITNPNYNYRLLHFSNIYTKYFFFLKNNTPTEGTFNNVDREAVDKCSEK